MKGWREGGREEGREDAGSLDQPPLHKGEDGTLTLLTQVGPFHGIRANLCTRFPCAAVRYPNTLGLEGTLRLLSYDT